MCSFKTTTILLTVLFIPLLSIPFTHAQIPFDIMHCSHGMIEPISSGRPLTIYKWEQVGTATSNHENRVFENFTGFCMGVRNDSNGKSQNMGYCKFEDSDGDTFFVELNVVPPEWDWKFLGGTGKWKGITGIGQRQLMGCGRAIEDGWYQWIEEGSYQCCERIIGIFEVME